MSSASKPRKTTLPDAVAKAAEMIQRDPAAAAASLRDFLAQTPNHADAQLLLAVAARMEGQAEEARQLAMTLASKHPKWAPAHSELGNALAALGRGPEAIAAFARAAELAPDSPGVWRALGDEHYKAGETAAADQAYEHHVESAERDPLLRQAVQALEGGRADLTEAMARERLRFHATDIVAQRLLADVCANTGRAAEAETLLADCTARAPGYAPAQLEYVQVLMQLNRYADALARIEALQEQAPDSANLLTLKVIAQGNLGNYEAAISDARRLMAMHPGQVGPILRLAHLLRITGQRDEAIALYQAAIARDPSCGEAYWALANMKTYVFTDNEIAQMKTMLSVPNYPEATRAAFRFALGHALDQKGEYAEAFKSFATGNALKRMQVTYDPDSISTVVHNSTQTLTKELFEQRSGNGADATDPIFIVGLPRSGSTLIEQVLASHSRVEGIGELRQLMSIAGEIAGTGGDAAYAKALAALDADDLKRFGEAYLEQLRPYRRSGRPIFTDKTPNNFLHVGLIQLILPNAKIIDVRRHPMACGYSNFTQLFGAGHEFAYRLNELGRFYRDYVALMAHYDAALPGRIYRVFYEKFVADPEGETRALLAHCGLDFEEACLKPHENTRPILTPSAEQVRQPISIDNTDHWRHYEASLGPLKAALGPVLEAYPDMPDTP